MVNSVAVSLSLENYKLLYLGFVETFSGATQRDPLASFNGTAAAVRRRRTADFQINSVQTVNSMAKLVDLFSQSSGTLSVAIA